MKRGVVSYQMARSGRGYTLKLDCGHTLHVHSLPAGRLSAHCWCCGADCECHGRCEREAALEREEQMGKEAR